jgi:hypothetical protein
MWAGESQPAGHGKKELCSGISHKGMKSANFRPENRLTDVRADESSPVPGNTHGRRRYESVGAPPIFERGGTAAVRKVARDTKP